jgi:hypothetical protein
MVMVSDPDLSVTLLEASFTLLEDIYCTGRSPKITIVACFIVQATGISSLVYLPHLA